MAHAYEAHGGSHLGAQDLRPALAQRVDALRPGAPRESGTFPVAFLEASQERLRSDHAVLGAAGRRPLPSAARRELQRPNKKSRLKRAHSKEKSLVL